MTAAPYQTMPPLSADEFASLKQDIRDRGIMVAVEYDQDGAIIDGYHRVRACQELGIKD
jgi:ParB-like chromosome segregation protein Spo0J